MGRGAPSGGVPGEKRQGREPGNEGGSPGGVPAERGGSPAAWPLPAAAVRGAERCGSGAGSGARRALQCPGRRRCGRGPRSREEAAEGRMQGEKRGLSRGSLSRPAPGGPGVPAAAQGAEAVVGLQLSGAGITCRMGLQFGAWRVSNARATGLRTSLPFCLGA